MSASCEYSKLVTPTDVSYLHVIKEYVSSTAQVLGITKPLADSIGDSVSDAGAIVMNQSYGPELWGNIEISCDLTATGFRTIIKETGLPLDQSEITQCSHDLTEAGLLCIRGTIDEVSVVNLGPDGQEIHLIKYLADKSVTDYFQACELKASAPAISINTKPVSFTVRFLKPADAIEVAGIAYRTYGYSYPNENMYYPQRLSALNSNGRIISVVAVTDKGEIAGHSAIFGCHGRPQVCEIGQAVVRPELRGKGCLRKMTEFLLNYCRNRGILGVYVRAVTAHSFSQKVSDKMGFKCCGTVLAYASMSTIFRNINESLPQRESFVVEYQYILKPRLSKIFPPDRHRDIVRKIYSELGADVPPETPPESKVKEHTILLVTTTAFMPEGFAKIEIVQYGYDLLEKIKQSLEKLLFRKFEVIALTLNMTKPCVYSLVPKLEEIGFFFTGMLPGGEDDAALTMQYLNHVKLDYSKMETYSDWTAEIIEYVRKQDPNQKL